ncbi:MAG: hypothetical protein AAGI01_05185, partial [Myxococcota bacterium]
MWDVHDAENAISTEISSFKTPLEALCKNYPSVCGISDQIVALPRGAFEAALEGRAFEPASPPVVGAGSEVIGRLNDPNVLGIAGDYDDTPGPFFGDLFLVIDDPVVYESYDAPRAVSKQFSLEVAHGLSGVTPWKLTNVDAMSFSNTFPGT